MTPLCACSNFVLCTHKRDTLEKAIGEQIHDETGWVFNTALIRVVLGLDWLLEDTGIFF